MEDLIEKIYKLALAENPALGQIAESEIKDVIETAILEIENFEKVATNISQINQNLQALWVFSGPGTYDDVFVSDRYQDVPWTRGMDRKRITYTVELFNQAKSNVPTIIYNGSNQQNEILREVVKRGEIKIPGNNIIITGKNIQNTVDQIKNFVFPKHLHKSGGEIGLISHAPHLMRIVHILNKYQVIPKDMTVRLFPIATPESGVEEYKIMEIKGLLYYIFIGKNATVDAYSHLSF